MLLAVTFWGVSFVATKAALRDLSPVTLITTRFGMGALLLLALVAVRGQRVLPPRHALRSLAVMGFVGVPVHHLIQAHALTMTSAVNAGWLIGLTPLWSALLAALVLRQRPSGRMISGLLVGFVGAVIVITRGDPSSIGAGPAGIGDLLIVASTLNWAVYTVLGHATIRELGALRATAGATLLGWFMLLPPFVARAGWQEWASVESTGWIAVVFLGFACSGLGYLFWYSALEKLDASRVAAFLYVEPLVTLAAAAALLGERIGVASVVGGLLVLAGVAVVQAAPPRAPAAPTEDAGAMRG